MHTRLDVLCRTTKFVSVASLLGGNCMHELGSDVYFIHKLADLKNVPLNLARGFIYSPNWWIRTKLGYSVILRGWGVFFANLRPLFFFHWTPGIFWPITRGPGIATKRWHVWFIKKKPHSLRVRPLGLCPPQLHCLARGRRSDGTEGPDCRRRLSTISDGTTGSTHTDGIA